MKEKLIGKTKEEVKTLLKESKYRIVYEDGEYFAVTMDYNPIRFNLSLEKGIVTGVRMG